MKRLFGILALVLAPALVQAGNQIYEPLAASARAQLQRAVADKAVPKLMFDSESDGNRWMSEMSRRLERRLPDRKEREDLLRTVHYEAIRAGLDPQMVLGVIQVESGFRKYAVSSAGARGYMQVMPFWVGLIGLPDHNLFNLRTNIRYGCLILRHYLDMEQGNLFRALGRYNGSLGQAEYPRLVRYAWERSWAYQDKTT